MRSNVPAMISLLRRAIGLLPPAPPFATPISPSTAPSNSTKSSDASARSGHGLRLPRQAIPPNSGNFSYILRVLPIEGGSPNYPRRLRQAPKRKKEHTMGGELIGLVAVILGMGVPLGALYTYYRVRKLRSEERLAAIARGVDIPLQPEFNQAAHSPRAVILLVSVSRRYIATF